MAGRIGACARLRKVTALAFAIVGLTSLLGPPSASADESIFAAGPLDEIFVTDQLGCQLFQNETNQFDTGTVEEDDNYCGTFVGLAGLVFGDQTADELADLPYQEISQGPVTGIGSSANPYKLTTVVEVTQVLSRAAGEPAAQPAAEGDGLLTVTETETYVEGDDFYRTDVTVRNNTGDTLDPVLYHAGDCRLNGNDFGYAVDDAQTGSFFCAPVQINEVAGTASTKVQPPGNSNGILGFVPIGGGSSKLEASAGEGDGPLFQAIDGTEFDNSCAHCTDPEETDPGDNGVGLSWALSIPSDGQVSRCFLTVNSFDNQVPDVPSGCSPKTSTNPPATVAQQPASSCALRISRARVFLFSRHPRLRLVARYRTDHPADVNIDFTAVEGGNKDPLGTVTRHFAKHGLFRLRKQLTDNEAEQLRDTDKFVVNFEIPGEPGFCARKYRKQLTVPRIIDGQRVVFQSDSKFGPGSPGHPENG